MAELKTQATDQSVVEYLNGITDAQKREDCFALVEIMQQITGCEPQMWGSAMVGFGRYRYTYASGHSGETFLTGFAPRKQNLTLYIMAGFERYDELLGRLGKYKIGKSCLYIKGLADIDRATLRELIAQSVTHTAEHNAQPSTI